MTAGRTVDVGLIDVGELSGGVMSADAVVIRYGPKNSNAMTTSNATKRIFFMNMTIAISMK
jgi:hypothetical protein